jgi:hypothetical protein
MLQKLFFVTVSLMTEQRENPSKLSSGGEDIRHYAGLHILARMIARKHAKKCLVVGSSNKPVLGHNEDVSGTA